ncbi:MAG: metal-dependent hydrolase [Clostridiales bacterium]|nr:metal-dependent hydrolase [Clostridiales bacterium]
MKIIYEGHSCFQILGNWGPRILLDPFISGNPFCEKSPQDFKPELILVSHGHSDHLGDALEIAKANGATLAASVDLLQVLDISGLKTIGFNMGGGFEFKEAKIHMMPASHGSNVNGAYAGLACGYMIHLEDKNLYFAGDTAIFGDMEKVLSRYEIDCAMLPIGGFYTMGPKDAITAAKWLKAKTVIPMHYNTFPVIKQDVWEFKEELEEKTSSKCLVLGPGQDTELGDSES